jgi:hypothetical protein
MPAHLINTTGAAVGKFNPVVQDVPGALLLPRSRASRKPPASTPNVVHDHTRLRQHQIAAIPCLASRSHLAHVARGHDRGLRGCEPLVVRR